MTPHPKIRKTVKWGGAAVTVLLVGVWVCSGWRYAIWQTPSGWMLSVTYGQMMIGDGRGTGVSPDWTLARTPEVRFEFLPKWSAGGSSNSLPFVTVPLWMIALPVAALTARAWRADARAMRLWRLTHCRACDYDRTGLAASAVCPECGRPPT